MDPANEVRYRHLDRERLEIVEVVQATPDSEIRYFMDGAEADTAAGEWRTMDCLDCHNRPTHVYELPHRAVDVAMTVGTLDPGIPWLRRETERVLREVEPNDDTTGTIRSALLAIYTEEHPEDLAILEASLGPVVATLTGLAERNLWPDMRITWGTYRSNLSHFDADGEFDEGGCFRCHNDELESAEGRTIEQGCEVCHTLVAVEEEDWQGVEGIDAAAFLQR